MLKQQCVCVFVLCTMAMFLFLFLLLLFWFSNVIFLGRGYCCRWCMIADVAACYSCLCSTEIKMRICTRDRETYTNTNARSPHVRISIYIYAKKMCTAVYSVTLYDYCLDLQWSQNVFYIPNTWLNCFFDGFSASEKWQRNCATHWQQFTSFEKASAPWFMANKSSNRLFSCIYK